MIVAALFAYMAFDLGYPVVGWIMSILAVLKTCGMAYELGTKSK